MKRLLILALVLLVLSPLAFAQIQHGPEGNDHLLDLDGKSHPVRHP